jgi:4-aminobutyrate aminotransferase
MNSKLTSKEVIEKHNQVMSQAVGHYVQVAFDRGKGSYLYDFEGKKYLDFAVGICVCSVGHCHPEVVKVAQEQIAKLMHTSSIGYYKEIIEFAELIRQIGPSSMRDSKVTFVNSGSEAVEAALKIPRMVLRKSNIIAFLGGFHGRPMGALAATASNSAYRKGMSGLMVGVQHAIFPNIYRNPFGVHDPDKLSDICLEIVREMIDHIAPAEDLAGILVEPQQGEGGYIPAPQKFIQGLRKICDETGSALIFDEIQTGFGRTGKMFAYEHFGVEPDVLVFAKSVGGGLPLGGVIATKELMDNWLAGSQGTTFGGNPVACCSGKKTIEIIQRDHLIKNAANLGVYAKEKLNEAKKEIPAIGDVRGLGLMIGVELINKDGSPATDLIKAFMEEIPKRGLVITKAGKSVIRICPALNITKEQLDEGLDIIIKTLKDLS